MDKGDPIFFSEQVSSARRFYLNLKPSPKSQLSVVCGGIEHCTPAYQIKRSTFPYYSLEFISGGKGSLTLNKSKHDLHPGMVFTYGPGIRHQIVTDAKRPLIKYFVDFAGLAAARLLKELGLAPGAMITTSAAKDVMVLFDDLIDTAQQHTRFHLPACKAILEHLLFSNCTNGGSPGRFPPFLCLWLLPALSAVHCGTLPGTQYAKPDCRRMPSGRRLSLPFVFAI